MEISDWRKKIDEVDETVLKLVNLRATMAIEIGKLKKQDGLSLRTPVRERQIVERMQSLNPGPLDGEAIEQIYGTVVNQCIRAQESSCGAAKASRNGASKKTRPATKRSKAKR